MPREFTFMHKYQEIIEQFILIEKKITTKELKGNERIHLIHPNGVIVEQLVYHLGNGLRIYKIENGEIEEIRKIKTEEKWTFNENRNEMKLKSENK